MVCFFVGNALESPKANEVVKGWRPKRFTNLIFFWNLCLAQWQWEHPPIFSRSYTIWRCDSYWTCGCSIAMLGFRGVREMKGEQSHHHMILKQWEAYVVWTTPCATMSADYWERNRGDRVTFLELYIVMGIQGRPPVPPPQEIRV